MHATTALHRIKQDMCTLQECYLLPPVLINWKLFSYAERKKKVVRLKSVQYKFALCLCASVIPFCFLFSLLWL